MLNGTDRRFDARTLTEKVRDRKNAARREYHAANAIAKLHAAIDGLRMAGMTEIAEEIAAIVTVEVN